MTVTGPSDLQRRLYDECRTARWDPDLRNTFAEEIAHLHEEVSEAFRAWRRYKDFAIHGEPGQKPEGVPVELADVAIGLFYLAELHGFDLLGAIEAKHAYNVTRDYVAEGRQLHAELTCPHPLAQDHGDGSATCAMCGVLFYPADPKAFR